MSLVPSVNGFEIDAGPEIPGELEEISFAPVAGIIKFPENTSDPDAIPPHDCKPFDIDSDLPMEEYCATGIPHSPCDPMPITVDVPCYTTVYVDTLPEEGIQGIMYVVPNGDLYAVYMWDGEQFNAVTSSSILQALTVNPSTSAQDILPEQGYDGFSSVHVNAIPPEYIIPSGTKNITQNGNGQDVAAYEYVNVNVPTVTPTGEKTINVSQNGTVTEDVTNYASAKVVTNVPNTYSASDEGKVVQNGALASQTSLTVNQNGTYVTTTNNEVVVDVSGGGFEDVYVSTSGAVTQTLLPDKFYHFTGALTSLDLTVGSTGQYHFEFNSPSTAVVLTLPQAVIMPPSFAVEVNTKYEIDILDNYGVYAVWVYGGTP